MEKYLGKKRYFSEAKRMTSEPGVATGLAWTTSGGDIIFIEATSMHGNGHLTLTGQLGDVMKESAQAALSWVRSHSDELGIAEDYFQKHDIHVHVPAGAVPKDGPSAGVTMTTALASLAIGKPVASNVGMTGEVTLSGKVLPIGGLKEKVLAARRAGLDTIILPRENEKDLDDVPEHLRKTMKFIPVDEVHEVLKAALLDGSASKRRKAPGKAAASKKTAGIAGRKVKAIGAKKTVRKAAKRRAPARSTPCVKPPGARVPRRNKLREAARLPLSSNPERPASLSKNLKTRRRRRRLQLLHRRYRHYLPATGGQRLVQETVFQPGNNRKSGNLCRRDMPRSSQPQSRDIDARRAGILNEQSRGIGKHYLVIKPLRDEDRLGTGRQPGRLVVGGVHPGCQAHRIGLEEIQFEIDPGLAFEAGCRHTLVSRLLVFFQAVGSQYIIQYEIRVDCRPGNRDLWPDDPAYRRVVLF